MGDSRSARHRSSPVAASNAWRRPAYVPMNARPPLTMISARGPVSSFEIIAAPRQLQRPGGKLGIEPGALEIAVEGRPVAGEARARPARATMPRRKSSRVPASPNAMAAWTSEPPSVMSRGVRPGGSGSELNLRRLWRRPWERRSLSAARPARAAHQRAPPAPEPRTSITAPERRTSMSSRRKTAALPGHIAWRRPAATRAGRAGLRHGHR